MAPKLFRRSPSPNPRVSGPRDSIEKPPPQTIPPPPRTSENWYGLRAFLTSSPAFVLLAFVPVGILAGMYNWNPTFVFSCNMLAILPLAMLLSDATEELAAEAGEVVGALLNATFGNAVEMIVSTVALTRGEVKIVQSSMLGAILSNILLCLGTCLFIGGYSHDCQFNATAAGTMASLMVVASSSLVIPAALKLAFPSTPLSSSSFDPKLPPSPVPDILFLSRGTAIILLILYLCYLHFQLRTHSHMFEEPPHETNIPATPSPPDSLSPRLSPTLATAVLAGVSVLIALCAENLVSTLDSVVHRLHIPKTFIGLIILPIVGNAAEYVSAMRAAAKGRMSLSLGVAVGSSMQIALFVTPALVMLGWCMGVEMGLAFEPFGAVVFYLSVIVVEGIISDGDSNYLEGAMLVGTWCIIALAFFVFPTEEVAMELGEEVGRAVVGAAVAV